MSYKIGVDGGGTKTECILINDEGVVIDTQAAPGCNPSVVGAEKARSILLAAVESLRSRAAVPTHGATRSVDTASTGITHTLLCMAGSRVFWQEFAAELTGFGRVVATDDSVPILELATNGEPGLVLHSGTGSFVAARARDGKLHYAGGLGWRLGDPGSGYDIGRLAVVRALLDLQGWQPAPRLRALVCEHTGLSDAAAVTRYFYHEEAVNQKVAALTPAVLRLASEGDDVAQAIVTDSVQGLLQLAEVVAETLFPGLSLDQIRAGSSGHILKHGAVASTLRTGTQLTLAPIDGAPIEGVRRLLVNNSY